ncbi:MAG: phosphate ABC transporter substrate-binding protein PstS, partial [Gemmatimonadaceae bacterium]|nr:phosphate ABC transporter substrate-binding protein PstS [Gemmatimonadaceae bacterium]
MPTEGACRPRARSARERQSACGSPTDATPHRRRPAKHAPAVVTRSLHDRDEDATGPWQRSGVGRPHKAAAGSDVTFPEHTVRFRTLVSLFALTAASAPVFAQSVDLTGAGATFPYPIYSKWFSDYAAKAGVRINYQSIGSGGGIRQLSEQTVDFGASDAPMSDAELAKAKGGKVLHFPTVLGAVVVTYNLPEVTKALKLSGVVLGDIFLGKITKWNDPRIAALNAGVKLPAKDILVVHRSDGSGTTFIFTDYLSAVAPAWKSGPGTGKEVRWPVGLGGKGNEG